MQMTTGQRRAHRWILALVLFLHWPAIAQAQDTQLLRGRLLNASTREPIPDAVIQVEGSAALATTQSNGRFALRLPSGRATLIVTAIGYETARQAVTVDTAAEVEVLLEPRPIELDEVLAAADRAHSAASSRVARDYDLLVRPVRSSQDLLHLAPGLVTSQHAGGGKAEQIFLRGFDADHGTDVAIRVDGMPVNLVSHGHGQGYADLHFLIPDVVERVDVAKGPYSPEVGNFATAGAVSFSTRDHVENVVRTEAGEFGTGAVTALYQLPTAGPHQGAYLAGQFYRTDGPFDSPQGFARFNIFGKYHAHPGEDARLAVTASGFSSAWDASGQIPLRAVQSGLIPRFGAIDDGEGGTTGRQDVNVEYEAMAGDGRLRLNGWFSRYNFKLFSNFTFFLEDDERGDMIEQTDRRDVRGLDGEYRFFHNASVAATLGGGYRADDVEVGLWKSPDRTRTERLVDAAIAERNLYLWGREDIQISPRARLQLGLRWDYFTFDVDDRLDGVTSTLPHASGYAHESILSPKVNFVFQPNDRIDLFANAGAGFHSNDARDVVLDQRIAELTEDWQADGIPDAEIEDRLRERNFDPEHESATTLPRAVGAELGMRVRPHRGLNVAAAAWLIDLEREFVYVGDGGFTELSGRSRRYGIDLELRAGLNAWLSADADITLSRGIFRDEPDDANAVPLAPTLTATGGITALRGNGIEGSLRFVHIGDRPANETRSVTAEGYTVFNLVGGYRTGPVRLSFTLENVFDTEWNEAQFDTESRLRGETEPTSELHFTPGNPRNVRFGVSLFF